MNTDVVNKTYDLVDEIKQHPSYVRLLELQRIIESNNTIKALIEDFNKQKDKYEDAKQYGKYHPDLKEIQLKLKEAKENLYNSDIIIEYKKCEKDIQDILNNISKELANTVSGKIKHPNALGLVNKH